MAGGQEEEAALAASFPWPRAGYFAHISCQGAINLQEVMVCVFPWQHGTVLTSGPRPLASLAVTTENSQHPLILLASPALHFICLSPKNFFLCMGLCLSTLNKHTSQTLIRKPAAARKEVGTVSPLRGRLTGQQRRHGGSPTRNGDSGCPERRRCGLLSPQAVCQLKLPLE